MSIRPSLLPTVAAFEARYRVHPRWLASAPGRVNLIGEFTDYNDGFVLPMALGCRTAITAAPNDTELITLHSDATRQTLTIDLREPLGLEAKGNWGNYVRGVLAGFQAAGIAPRGFDALIYSDVPMGAGLSSSAALEVAFASLLEGVTGAKLDPVTKALLCQKAEHTYAQVPCGIMDPFIATLGQSDHALLLDCRSYETVWLPFSDPATTVLLINTRVKHQLSTSAYATRREECRRAAEALGVPSLRMATEEALSEHLRKLDSTIVRRTRHVIREIARTVQAAQCIREGDWLEFGQLMDASHGSLKDDYEVSCKELDIVVQIAREIGVAGGVFGCRMTGGGFGGCAVALIESAKQEGIKRTFAEEYLARTGLAAELLVSRAGSGAEVIEL